VIYILHTGLALASVKPEMTLLLKLQISGLESIPEQVLFLIPLFIVFSPPFGIGEDKECIKIP